MLFEARRISVAIVPGHAGKRVHDPGAGDSTGPGDPLATWEVEHTIPLAMLLGSRLSELGARTYTVTGSVPETVRVIASRRPTVAISLHLNAATDPAASGFEVWHYPGSRAGANLALNILWELSRTPGFWAHRGILYKNRGAKPAEPGTRPRSFVSVPGVPAVLVEAGFLSNAAEERLINSALFRAHVASSVARGVVTSCGGGAA